MGSTVVPMVHWRYPWVCGSTGDDNDDEEEDEEDEEVEEDEEEGDSC